MARRRVRRGKAGGLLALIAAAGIYLFLRFAPAPAIEGQVVKVLDGDTIEVMQSGKPVRIRLTGVDCPERRQPYGTAAKEFTAGASAGKVVKVRDHGKDGYGRMLGEVILPDGSNLNQQLVGSGMAWWYEKYSPDDSLLAGLQSEARAARRGLWQDKNPVPPWEYRERNR